MRFHVHPSYALITSCFPFLVWNHLRPSRLPQPLGFRCLNTFVTIPLAGFVRPSAVYLKLAVKARFSLEKQERISMPKRTFQPNRHRRVKTHGFRARMKTKSGTAVLSRRRAAGRKRVSVSAGFRD